MVVDWSKRDLHDALVAIQLEWGTERQSRDAIGVDVDQVQSRRRHWDLDALFRAAVTAHQQRCFVFRLGQAVVGDHDQRARRIGRGRNGVERLNPGFKEETNMSELRYPNESREYRDARDSLLKDEQELIDKIKSVAERRRNLPPGGQLKEDYVFQWANDGKVGKSVQLSELFADKNTLLLYSFMYGPSWDKPCPSCTSLVDGFDRTWYQVTQDAAFVAIAKAPADRINAWAKERGWSQIALVSGSDSAYQADYKCQGDSDDMQWPVMHVFRRQGGKIVHFWGTELAANHLDTVWPYWNLMDFTPDGRPDIPTPPQKFRSEFLEKHYLNKE